MAPSGGVTTSRVVTQESTDLCESLFNNDDVHDSDIAIERCLLTHRRKTKRTSPLRLEHTFSTELDRLAGKTQDVALDDFGSCLSRSLEAGKQRQTRDCNWIFEY